MDTRIEYRVRAFTRYLVTRYEAEFEDGCCSEAASTQRGEFANFETAYAVAYALCKAEHDRLGYAPEDERIRYPDPSPPNINRQGLCTPAARPTSVSRTATP